MYGTIGMIRLKNVTPGLIGGLEKLEYHGYDSAGIFVSDGTTDHLIKAQGRIQNLKDRITSDTTGNIGIGHTRWATHGQPSKENAHPHTSRSRRFVLVHNGVIENFKELKNAYLTDDHFISETDTEITTHLIETLAKDMTAKEAFLEALRVIKGSYALALIDRATLDVIYVAKNRSPLLVGLGDGFNVIASDAMAMLARTKKFVEVKDEEMVTVTPNKIIIQNFAGDIMKRSSFEVQVDASNIEEGIYPFYMLKEVGEQPIIMRRTAQKYVTEGNRVPLDSKLIDTLSDSDRIYIVACGTNYHAGLAGEQTLEELTQIPVEIYLASEFGYNTPLLSQKPFFIFLSQSGETADSRRVLVKINRLDYPSLTTANVAGSTLSREASFTLLSYAGPKITVASTKAYAAQIAVLTLLAKAIGDKKELETSLSSNITHELSLVANAMESVITQRDYLEELAAGYLSDTRNALYVGHETDYNVSLEAASKLKEISYIQAEGFAAGELKHGTIALIEGGTPAIGIISEEVTGAHTRGDLKGVESRGAKILVIVSGGLEKENDQLVLPAVHPYLSTLATVVPTQLLAYYATLLRGFDADKPRNLAKSVTVE